MELSKIKAYFSSPHSRDIVFADENGDYLFIKKGRFNKEVSKQNLIEVKEEIVKNNKSKKK